MSPFGIKKNLDQKLANRFVLKYCSMRSKYDTDAVTKAATEVLREAYIANKEYANTALKVLKDKYPQENFPENLE